MEALPFSSVTFTQGEHDIAARVLAHYNNDPKRWTKRTCARNQDGISIADNPRDRKAVCWCMFGVTCELLLDSDLLLSATRKAKNDPEFEYIGWQDAIDRTFSEVRDLLESIVAGPVAE